MHKTKNILLLANICLALMILNFISPAWAAEYYVKSGGNDNLDGLSDATAWATIAKVEATVANGDTVYFRSQDTWFGTAPILTAAAGVTYDGETYGSGTRAKFDCTGDPSNRFYASLIHINNVSNVIVKGFEIDGNDRAVNNYGIAIGSYYTSRSFSGITIDNCYIHDCTNRGLYVGSEGNSGVATISNVTISNTEIKDTNRRTSPSYGGGSGLVIYPSWNSNLSIVDRVENLTVTSCKIHGNYLSGIYLKDDIDGIIIQDSDIYNNIHGFNIECSNDVPGETDPQAIMIRRNHIHDNKTAGIWFTNGPADAIGPINIRNNMITNNGHTGGSGTISDIMIGYGMDTSTINIHNNTIYNSDNDNVLHTASVYVGSRAGSSMALDFRNNIIYTVNDLGLYDQSGYIDIFSNNLIYRSSAQTDPHMYRNGITYDRDGTSSDLTNFDANAQKTDPLFIDVGNDNYKIGGGSDAIDNGADLSAYFSTDYYSSTIPQNAVFDIGAHQYDGIDTPADDTPAPAVVSRVQGVRVIINGIPITSVNASSNDGNIPENTLDNDPNTRWSALGLDEWIEFDLGTENNLQYALISFYVSDVQSTNSFYFKIEVSNDRVNWQEVFTGSSNSSGANNVQERFNFASGTTGRYVRYIGSGNQRSNWNSINEFDVF